MKGKSFPRHPLSQAGDFPDVQGFPERIIEQGKDEGPAQSIEPLWHVESQHQVYGLVRDQSVAGRKAEVLPLVADVVFLKSGQGLGYVLQVHPPAQLQVVSENPLLLDLRHGAVGVLFHPSDRLEDKGGQNVEEVFIGDVEAAVHGIHAADGPSAPEAVHPVFEDFKKNELGVVVAFSRPLGELAGLRQQAGDGWNGEGAEKRKLQ